MFRWTCPWLSACRSPASARRRWKRSWDSSQVSLEVRDFQVPGEGLAEVDFPVGEVAAVGLGKQLAERRSGGGLVGARLLEAPRLAGDRVGSAVDVHPERSAGEPLDVAPGGGGHGSKITRSAGHSFHDPFHGTECQRSNYAIYLGAAYRHRTDNLRIT